MVFALVIAVILMAMTTVAVRPTIEQEGPRGLAYTLAADLRAARAEAVRSGRPVAFCFASGGGSNSLSRAAHIRKGEQRGAIWRSVNYESEYDATIFVGQWEGAAQKDYNVPPSWKTSTSRELALFFGPDGRAYSEDLPELAGRYAIVTASQMEGRFDGPTGVLRAARNAQTVWVNRSGSVEVETDQGPLGPIPEGGTDQLAVAELTHDSRSGGSAPTILGAKFLPQKNEELDTAGIAQNFVQIHPNQKDGQQLEYGLANLEVKVEDPDGGPLTYTLTAEPSGGDPGKFSIAQQSGEMSYVYDERTHGYYWKAVVAWRPPPAADVDLTYELTMTISDPEGNTVVASTAAGLLPGVTNLPPARIVFETAAGRLYLTNLDGANEVCLNKRATEAGPEYDPFFSRDGSSIFSFHDRPDGTHQLRGRPANGNTDFIELATFAGTSSSIHFDPTLTYAAITTPAGTQDYPWGEVTPVPGSDPPTYTVNEGVSRPNVTHIAIVNLMSTDPPINVTDESDGTFFWAANRRHVFEYGEREPTPLVSPFGLGPFHEPPGHQSATRVRHLAGFPPNPVPAGGSIERADGRIYNPADEDWYLIVEGNRLMARRQGTSQSAEVHNAASFEFDTRELRRNPSWSADGERVAFITNPGPDAHVVTKHVLDETMSLRPSLTSTFNREFSHAHSAQLSPDGRWVYFHRNQKVFRTLNQPDGRVVNITEDLEADVVDYAVSP